jgi:hypothetical protein
MSCRPQHPKTTKEPESDFGWVASLGEILDCSARDIFVLLRTELGALPGSPGSGSRGADAVANKRQVQFAFLVRFLIG